MHLALLGYLGTTLSLIAYLPQTIHVIKEHCSAGLSLQTYLVWFLASMLFLTYALFTHEMIFTVQQLANALAVLVILFYGKKYQYGRCPYHKTHA